MIRGLVTPDIQPPMQSPPKWLMGGAEFVLLALALGGLSILVAYLAPAAPDSFMTNGVGIGVLALVASTVAISAVARLVERRRGRTPDGEALAIIKSCRTRFGTALAPSLVGLALLLVTVRIFARGGSDLLVRAWYLLLFGGALVTVAGILLANILFLIQSREG